MASSPPAHCLSIVNPPMLSGKLEAKTEGLAGLPPPPTAFDKISSSIEFLEIFAFFNNPLITGAANSWILSLQKAPP